MIRHTAFLTTILLISTTIRGMEPPQSKSSDQSSYEVTAHVIVHKNTPYSTLAGFLNFSLDGTILLNKKQIMKERISPENKTLLIPLRAEEGEIVKLEIPTLQSTNNTLIFKLTVSRSVHFCRLEPEKNRILSFASEQEAKQSIDENEQDTTRAYRRLIELMKQII